MTPKEAAINLIKVYVKRGDTLQDLQKSWMGTYLDSYKASIGGHIFPPKYHKKPLRCPSNLIKKVPSNKILVEMVDGKIVNEVFSLKDIFNEIKSENIQKTLL